MTAPNPLPSYIYKILPNVPVFQGTPVPVPADWTFPQTEIDARDGYTHLSTLAQLPGTLTRFFNDDESVQLLKVDYKRVSAFKIVKWEEAGNGDVFPHLYAILTGEYVRDLKAVPKGESWVATVEKLVQEGWLEG